MNTDPLALAQSLLIPNGLAPLPIYAGTKRATIKWGKWQAEGFPVEQLPMLFHDPDLTVAAICGAASGNLVVPDCDTHDQFDALRDAMNDPETWIGASPRGGHIYFRTRIPVRSDKKNPEMQILGQGCYVMVPGALHPSGKHYKFIKQTPHIAELPALTSIPGVVLEPILVRPTGMPRLAWKLLTGQEVKRSYDSDSAREYAAICSMVNGGMSFERIHSAFVKLASKSSHFGRWLTERGGSNSAKDMLERMYRKALKFTAHDSPDRALAKEMRLWLADHPLTGRSGVYDALALDRILQIALAAGSLSVAVSTRDLGEDIGVSRHAASKALHRLQERGFIELETEWTGPFANIYRVRPPQTMLQNLTTTTQNLNVRKWLGFGNENQMLSIASHDAFRHGALSKSCAQVWEWLLHAPMTQTELVARTGRSTSTISRVLDILQANQMIEPNDLRGRQIVWQSKGAFDLNALARWYETAGKGAAQALKHEREREQRRREWEQREEFSNESP